MPPAGTNQQRALSVRLDAKRLVSQVLCAIGQETKPRDSRPHPSQSRCPSTLRCHGMSSIQHEPGLMYTGKIVWMYYVFREFIPLEGVMDRKSTHRKLTLGALVLALPLALGDLQAADDFAPRQTPAPSPRTSRRFSTRIVLAAISPAR